MNEPKKRGRPPKASIEGADVKSAAPVAEAAPSEPVAEPVNAEFARRQAKAYALRVWNGQSSSLSRHERLGRVAVALQAQGMSMEGVELP